MDRHELEEIKDKISTSEDEQKEMIITLAGHVGEILAGLEELWVRLYPFLLGIALTLLFVSLKLDNIITWDWVWVMSPSWLGFIVLVIFGFKNR